MVSAVLIGETFALFLVAIAFVPSLRAYLLERDAPWLVAGVTALLIGRIAALVEHVAFPTAASLVEHGVGLALAGALIGLHLYAEWHTEDSEYRLDRRDLPAVTGDD